MRLEGRLKCGMDIMHAVLEFGPIGTYIDKIDIDGISGFVPISSLDDLPVSPTSEQKRQAYLLGNILYVYVGRGGDTLGGKYQSVELVSLDWGDKSYNTSEFSGLGRRWLKKNMVEDVNVLTAAMIGTDNTEYFIQYDYDLDGATVTLPANASLVFMGGSIKNGTLIGNNTRIQAKKGVCIFDNITIQGTWDVAEAYSSWFKMHKGGYKIASVTEDVVTLRRGTDANYYDAEDLTYINYKYYVTSTLENGQVVASSVQVDVTTYATFRVEGDNTDYLAAPKLPADVFEEAGYAWFDASNHNGVDYTQRDDTEALQSLFDIRAKRTIVEEGIYMVDAEANIYGREEPLIRTALYYDGQKDSELVIEGWIKLIPNDYTHSRVLDVVGCSKIRIYGKGGIQGDLLEHTVPFVNINDEHSHVFTVSCTTDMIVESLTFAYAWGDCIYSHWKQNFRTLAEDKQENHTYKNVKVIYGGRTGYGCERADNVVVDGCYFYGSGRVRGKATNSAVDVEPFNDDTTPQRFVKNYEFKNNVFKNSASGLRLERCVDCSIHNNEFDYGWSGIDVVWHKDASHNITDKTNRAYIKSRMSIYGNIIKRCTVGIYLRQSEIPNAADYKKFSENVHIYDNTLVSCPTVLNVNATVKNCTFYNNTTYGCGQWYITGALINCDIYNNKSYACRMPELTSAWGAGRLIYITQFSNCKMTKFHDNHFSLDYGKPIYGLGEDGKEVKYYGMPIGYRYYIASGADLTDPTKIHFYNNHVDDDFFVCYSSSNNFEGNDSFSKGLCSVRDENSKVFLKGDIFRSSTYGDEGIVVAGAMLGHSWIDEVREFSVQTETDENDNPIIIYMDVEYGEIVKIVDNKGNEDTSDDVVRLKICNKAGTCGDSLGVNDTTSGTAGFYGASATGYAEPDNTVKGRLKIAFTTRGVCTSGTRPETFLYAGRRMWETDTNKEIVYDGTDWVYNDIYTEE